MKRMVIAGVITFIAVVAMPADDPKTPVNEDRYAIERAKEVDEVLKLIKGKESEPAASVFKDVRVHKTMTAKRFVEIMDTSYSQALGVGCTHCHVPDRWESEEKIEKAIARDMAVMTDRINNEMLPAMKSLGDSGAHVTCFTCHRGRLAPQTGNARN